MVCDGTWNKHECEETNLLLHHPTLPLYRKLKTWRGLPNAFERKGMKLIACVRECACVRACVHVPVGGWQFMTYSLTPSILPHPAALHCRHARRTAQRKAAPLQQSASAERMLRSPARWGAPLASSWSSAPHTQCNLASIKDSMQLAAPEAPRHQCLKIKPRPVTTPPPPCLSRPGSRPRRALRPPLELPNTKGRRQASSLRPQLAPPPGSQGRQQANSLHRPPPPSPRGQGKQQAFSLCPVLLPPPHSQSMQQACILCPPPPPAPPASSQGR